MIRPAAALCLGALFTIACVSGASAQEGNNYENLQFLPSDISRDALGDTMLGFLRSLGLPRRAGAGCLHCHEGDLAVPRSEWDYASDAKQAKRTARRMLEMVHDINTRHLAGLETRGAPDFSVGCVTCHEGRVDPRPLPMLLADAERAGGLDSLITAYRGVHGRFYGASAYDLRVGVLANLASERAESGDFDDAISLSTLNEETHPSDPSARRVTLSLHITRKLDEEGPGAAVNLFDEFRTAESNDVLTFSVLDGVGWRTFRQDRQADALVLLRRNREAFPDLYFTFESLVEAEYVSGEITQEEIILAYERFLEENPGHAMAEQNLTNHRRRDTPR